MSAPAGCAAAVVLLAPRVAPVKVVAVFPVYDMSSPSISIVPEEARVVVSLTGIVVAGASMPAERATGQLVSVSVPVLHRKTLYCLKSGIRVAVSSVRQDKNKRQLEVRVLDAS